MRAPHVWCIAIILLSLPLDAQAPAADITAAHAAIDSATAAVERGEGAAALDRARRSLNAARAADTRLIRLHTGSLERRLYLHDAAEQTLMPLAEAGTSGTPLDAAGVGAAMEMVALLQRRGRITEARQYVELAREGALAIGDSISAADAEIVLAGITLRTGNALAAWAHLSRADSVIGQRDPRIRARVHCQRAAMLGFGARSDASAEARRGAALAESAGARRIEASCWLAMGAGFAQRGVADSAMPALTRAVDLARAAHDDATLAAALQWRGYLHRILGRPGQAHSDLLAGVEAGSRSDTRNPLAWSWLNLGLVSLSLRDPAGATASLSAAAAEFESQGDQWGLHTAIQSQAGVLTQLGEFDSADSLTQRVREWGQRIGNRTTEADALGQLVRIARARGDRALARARLDTLGRLYSAPELRAWQGSLAYPRALDAIAFRRLEEAERLLRHRLQELPPERVSDRAAALSRLAEVQHLRGRPAEAAMSLASAMGELESQRASLNDEALRRMVFQTDHVSAEADLGVAAVIGGVASARLVEEAFALAERRRARELADRLLRLSGLTGAKMVVPRRYEPASLGALQDALRALGAAGLVYVAGRGSEPITVFVLTSDTAIAVSLATADSVDGLARRALGLLESGESPPSAVLRALHATLLAPVIAHLPAGTHRLLIVPEGPVHRVPFAALEDGKGAPIAAQYAIAMIPSATILTELQQRPRRTDAVRALVLADPAHDFMAADASAAANQLRAAFMSAGAAGPLPGARREARRVARFAPVRDVRLGRHATAAALRQPSVTSYRVIHIASHSVIDDASPLRSAIALAPAGDDHGFVTAADLATTRFDADLVVLSACRTARGRLLDGEGEQGLAAALLASGARAVVVSHWNVRDDATARLMEDLYAAIASGLPVVDALAVAQRRSIARAESPAVWASFAVVGDPLAAPPLEEPRRFPLALLLAATAVVGSLLLARRARRRTHTH